MTDRIEAIRKMLENQPEDVFLHYSLGMEYAAAERHADAIAEFKRCIELDEKHLPAQVEAGKALRSAGRLDEARRTFTAAMALAAELGQSHTRDFIQQQIEALPKE